MLYLVLLVAIMTIALMAFQRYALGKARRGFSLYDSDHRPHGRVFPHPDDEAVRQWLESDDDDASPAEDL